MIILFKISTFNDVLKEKVPAGSSQNESTILKKCLSQTITAFCNDTEKDNLLFSSELHPNF